MYADLEPFGPGTTVDLHLPLAAGRYALACLMEDQAPVTGPPRTITGAGTGAPGVPILTQSQLVPATQRYERWVRTPARSLGPRHPPAPRRSSTAAAGAARVAWLTAHLDYQRLGATYAGFGDLGDAIDGLPSGLPGGAANTSLDGVPPGGARPVGTGPAERRRADVAALDRAVSALPALVRQHPPRPARP